jgi:hypothetical protein
MKIFNRSKTANRGGAVALILAATILLAGCGENRTLYKEAEALFDDGKYYDAMLAFEKLDDYKDSSERVTAARKYIGKTHGCDVFVQGVTQQGDAIEVKISVMFGGNQLMQLNPPTPTSGTTLYLADGSSADISEELLANFIDGGVAYTLTFKSLEKADSILIKMGRNTVANNPSAGVRTEDVSFDLDTMRVK